MTAGATDYAKHVHFSIGNLENDYYLSVNPCELWIVL